MKPTILGAILVAALLFADTGSAMAARKWLEFRSDNFIIYSNAGKKRTLKLAEDLEYFRHYMQLFTKIKDTKAPQPLTIYAFNNLRNFQKELNTGAAGFYLDRPSGALAFAGLNRSHSRFNFSGRHVLFHEYVHFFLAQFSPLRYPAWFNEGLAEFYSSFKRKKSSMSVGLPVFYRLPALSYYEWLPIEKLLSANRRIRKEKNFYGQSWITVHYLLSDPERYKQINNYIFELNFGKSVYEAFEASFDISMAQLDQRIVEYWNLRKLNYQAITLGEGGYTPEFSVRELSKAEALLMLAGAYLKLGQKDYHLDKASEYIGELREDFGPSEEATAMQIELLMARGLLAEAKALLSTLPQSERATERVLLLEGKIYLLEAVSEKSDRVDQRRIAQALPVLEAAKLLNPNSADILFQYGRAIVLSEDLDPMLAVTALSKARDLLPQNDEIERAYAEAIMKAGYDLEAAEIFQDYLNWSGNEAILKWARRNLEKTGIAPETLFNSGMTGEKVSQSDKKRD